MISRTATLARFEWTPGASDIAAYLALGLVEPAEGLRRRVRTMRRVVGHGNGGGVVG